MGIENPYDQPSVRISRIVAASPQAVFDAWTDPDRLRRWFGPEGTTVGLAEVDLRIGGRYRIRIDDAEGGHHTVSGEYREITPPERLVFTWDWEEAAHRMGVETIVTIDILAVEEGSRVTVTHSRFPSDDAARGHDEGWNSSLDELEGLLA